MDTWVKNGYIGYLTGMFFPFFFYGYKRVKWVIFFILIPIYKLLLKSKSEPVPIFTSIHTYNPFRGEYRILPTVLIPVLIPLIDVAAWWRKLVIIIFFPLL